MSDLLPCPFCGGEAFLDVMSRRADGEPDNYSPECKACGATIIIERDFSKTEAIAAWNTRHPVTKEEG